MPLAIPLVAGIASLIFMSAISVNGEVSDVICYSAGLTYTVIFWVINRFSVVNLRHYFPRQEQTPRRIGYMVLVALVSVFIVKGGIDRVEKLFMPAENTDYVEPSVLFSVAVSFTLCLLVLAIYESIYFFTKYRSSLLEQERLAKQNMQAQLSVLKQQVNPHFLFNSLNTLTNIIPEDPSLSTRFVQRLAAVYTSDSGVPPPGINYPGQRIYRTTGLRIPDANPLRGKTERQSSIEGRRSADAGAMSLEYRKAR